MNYHYQNLFEKYLMNVSPFLGYINALSISYVCFWLNQYILFDCPYLRLYRRPGNQNFHCFVFTATTSFSMVTVYHLLNYASSILLNYSTNFSFFPILSVCTPERMQTS